MGIAYGITLHIKSNLLKGHKQIRVFEEVFLSRIEIYTQSMHVAHFLHKSPEYHCFTTQIKRSAWQYYDRPFFHNTFLCIIYYNSPFQAGLLEPQL